MKTNLLLIVIVAIVFILCLLLIKVTFDSFPSDNPSLICENGTLQQVTSNDPASIADSSPSMTNLVLMADASQCFLRANAYTGATAQTVCINNEPTVICRVPLYKAILMGKIMFLQNSKNSSANPTNNNSNKNLDDIIQSFSGTDWNSQGDNSPIVKNFCIAVCSPFKMNSYGIGGYIKVISCDCGNIDSFKGTATGVGSYIFTYENNVLKQISSQEYAQRLADYHKNNP